MLAEFGNMSAPTALFVLERVMAQGMPARIALSALGPGFTLSSAVWGAPHERRSGRGDRAHS